MKDKEFIANILMLALIALMWFAIAEMRKADYEQICSLDSVVCPDELVEKAGAAPIKTKQVKAIVYGYSSEVEQTDDSPFVTAMGSPVYFGVIANNCLGFGTTILVPGYENSFVVQDRMNPRYDCSYFDIWFPTKEEAIAWGKKEVILTYYDTMLP